MRKPKEKWEESTLQPLCTDKDCECSGHPEYCCTVRLQMKGEKK